MSCFRFWKRFNISQVRRFNKNTFNNTEILNIVYVNDMQKDYLLLR